MTLSDTLDTAALDTAALDTACQRVARLREHLEAKSGRPVRVVPAHAAGTDS